MEADILFDQVVTVFRSIIEQKQLRIIRKEKASEFDYRMMILESPSIKIRFTLDRGLVSLAIATLDAPNDGSRDQWFNLDILLSYLGNQKVSPFSRVACSVFTFLGRNRNREQKHNSVIYDMDDHATSVLHQLNKIRHKLVGSYDKIEAFLQASLSSEVIEDLERFRVQYNDEILDDLIRKR
jgi:hypothetical protein